MQDSKLDYTTGNGNSHCLIHRLVQDGQIAPREGVGGVDVNGGEIGLYRVTGLPLLVVQLAAGGGGGRGQ